jgi:hypothetical protein
MRSANYCSPTGFGDAPHAATIGEPGEIRKDLIATPATSSRDCGSQAKLAPRGTTER